MARYTYNKAQVNECLDLLKDSGAAIVDTNNEIQSGINMINNARGAVNLDLDESFLWIKGLQSQVQESINAITSEISNKARQIEEYENAPWLKKIFATIGMAALKLVEGLGTFIENIGDGVVTILGFVPGLIFPSFQESISEFIKKDYVGDFFADQYEEGFLKSVNTYSAMAHDSTAASIFKGVGVAAGYVIVGVATAGIGAGAAAGSALITTGTAISAGTAFVGGVGSGTQSGLQSGKTFNQAALQGLKDGVIAGGTTLVVGAVANKLTAAGRATGNMVNSSDELTGNITKFQAAASADDTFNAAADVAELAAKNSTLTGSIKDFTSAATKTPEAAKLVAQQAGDVITSAQALKSAAIAANASDDVINSLDDIINSATKTATSASNAVQALTPAASVATKISDLGTKVGGKTGQVITNVGNKLGTATTGIKNAVTGTKVGAAAVKGLEKAGTAITNFATSNPTAALQIAGGLAAGTGAIIGTDPLKDIKDSKEYREAEDLKVTPGQQLGEEITTTYPGGGETPGTEIIPSPEDPGTGGDDPGTTTPGTTTPETGGDDPGTTTPGTTTPGTGSDDSGTGNDDSDTSTPVTVTPPSGGTDTTTGGNDTSTDTSTNGDVSYREEVKPDSSDDLFGNLLDKDEQTSTPIEDTTDSDLPQQEVLPDSDINIPSIDDSTNQDTTTNGTDVPTTDDSIKQEVTPDSDIDIPTIDNSTNNSTNTDTYTPPVDNGGYNGGGYSGSYNGGYSGSYNGGSSYDAAADHVVPEEMAPETELNTPLDENSDSITELVGGGDYVNIPTATTPLTADPISGTKKSSIPVIAGLSAAAVGGIGTKAFMDRKVDSKKKESKDETDEWTTEDELDMSYDKVSLEEKDYLDPTDEYAYQEGDEIVESYQAVNSSELESMQ